MSKTVVLELGQTPADPVRWSAIEAGRVGDGGECRNVEAAAGYCADADKIIAVLPGERVAARWLETPPSSIAKFRAAARFLFEDELAAGVDNLHYVVSRSPKGDGVVAGVERAALRELTEAFVAAGIVPDVLTVDFALSAAPEGGAALVVDRDRVFGVVKKQGVAAERPWADDVMRRALSEGSGEGVQLTCTDPGLLQRFSGIDGAEIVVESLPERAVRYCNMANSAALLNFLQGEFRKRRNWKAGFDQWKRSAALAAACVLFLAVGQIVSITRDVRAAHAIEQRIAEVHRAAFPEASGVSPVSHARSILAAGGEGAGFLFLTREIAAALEENSNIQLQRIRFNGPRTEYTIQLEFADINELEALKRVLSARGLSIAETGGVRRSGGLYVGEIEVGKQ